VWKKHQGLRDIQHVGSAHTGDELEELKAEAWRIIAAGQGELDLALLGHDGLYPVIGSKAVRLWDALVAAYAALGFDVAVPDPVFAHLVFARIVEPTSKLDSIRVLAELGIKTASYSTIKRRLVDCVAQDWRGLIQDACLTHALGESDLRFCLYDVTTLHWETQQGDGFREPGFNKQRHLEPQCLVGLLTTKEGFPLHVTAFHGKEAETNTIVPVLKAFRQANNVEGLTVVADAGMMSQDNVLALLGAGFSVIVGYPIPREPFVVKRWRQKHPGQGVKDGQVFCQPINIGVKGKPVWCVIYYQYRAKRARRDLASIKKTWDKAEAQVKAGSSRVQKNRFIKLEEGQYALNEALRQDAEARAGYRAYFTDRLYAGELEDHVNDLAKGGAYKRRETNRLRRSASEVIAAYHDLWHVEHAFRCSKNDLAARPAFHHVRDSIEAHLTIVLAALAVSKWIETVSGVSLRRFLHLLKPIRRVELEVNGRTICGEPPLSEAVLELIATIKQAAGALG